jgi:hypothetical protein
VIALAVRALIDMLVEMDVARATGSGVKEACEHAKDCTNTIRVKAKSS